MIIVDHLDEVHDQCMYPYGIPASRRLNLWGLMQSNRRAQTVRLATAFFRLGFEAALVVSHLTPDDARQHLERLLEQEPQAERTLYSIKVYKGAYYRLACGRLESRSGRLGRWYPVDRPLKDLLQDAIAAEDPHRIRVFLKLMETARVHHYTV